MPKFCGKCGAPINENMKFCTKCGYNLINTDVNADINTPESQQQTVKMPTIVPERDFYEAPMTQPTPPSDPTPPVSETQPDVPQESKKKVGKTVLVIILVIALLAGIGATGFIAYTRYFKKSQNEFMDSLQECTDRNLIAFYYDDYDADGKDEAYAIVGNDGETEKNYNNADIWFVNENETTQIKEDVSGHTNGIITQRDKKYVSFETKTSEKGETSSLIYGVKDNKSYEPEISGKYKNVHQDGEKIIAEVIKTGIEIELKINDDGDIEVGSLESENLTADDSDFTDLQNLISAVFTISPFTYSCDGDSEYEKMLVRILPNEWCDSPIFDYFYDYEPEIIETDGTPFSEYDNAEKDPLNKFLNAYSYQKVPADDVDWIIQNIFGIQVDRNKASSGIEVDGYCHIYYYEDYYYCKHPDGGDAGYETKITNKKINDDNTYTINLDVMRTGLSTADSKFVVQCKLQMLDGKRQWMLMSSELDMTPQDTVTPGTVKISDSPTASELTNVLVGTWYPVEGQNNSTDNYYFTADGGCRMLFSDSDEGTYTIDDDLTLHIKLPWTEETLTWDTVDQTSRSSWCINADGYFVAKGIVHEKVSD